MPNCARKCFDGDRSELVICGNRIVCPICFRSRFWLPAWAVDTLKIRDARDVEDAVRAAIAGEQPLEIIGHGSKRLIGQVMTTNAVLDLSALNAVTAYEPQELIITAAVGAPLADLMSLLDSKNQQFAFEPVDTA